MRTPKSKTNAPRKRKVDYDDRLLEWNELPSWMMDNEFLLSSYRKQSHSYQTSIKSLWKTHNETGNIWSHLIGAILFSFSLYRLFSVVGPKISSANTLDVVAVGVYYLGVVNCFVISTCHHLFSNHSERIHRLGCGIDHMGIVFVIYGTTISGTYFEFYCHNGLRNFYWILSTAFAVASGIFTLSSNFRIPSYRRTRFFAYTMFGVSALFPVIHGLILYGYDGINKRMSLEYFLMLGLLNFTGAAIYAARIPERWFPRTFDVWGHSHQIMHVLVVMGALSFERGLLDSFEWWAGRDYGACIIDLQE